MSATLPPGTYPPPNTALSEFEVAATFVTASAASPKLAAFPVDAIVIKSITSRLPGTYPPQNNPRVGFDAPPG